MFLVQGSLSQRDTNFSKLEEVLSGHAETANLSRASRTASQSPVSVCKVPVLPLAAVAAARCDERVCSEGVVTEGAQDSDFSRSTRSCSLVSPRLQSEDVSKLETVIVDLQHRNLELEAALHRCERQHRQSIFEEETAIMTSLQMSAEILVSLRNLSKAANVGKALGLLPLEQGRGHLEELMSLRKLADAGRSPANQVTPQSLCSQERGGYEREIAELRQMSEAMLLELQRRIQGVEQAEEEAALWRDRCEALQARLSRSDEVMCACVRAYMSACMCACVQ